MFALCALCVVASNCPQTDLPNPTSIRAFLKMGKGSKKKSEKKKNEFPALPENTPKFTPRDALGADYSSAVPKDWDASKYKNATGATIKPGDEVYVPCGSTKSSESEVESLLCGQRIVSGPQKENCRIRRTLEYSPVPFLV